MSLLDAINNRISELEAATDARYKAAGYSVPTAAERKVAEMSGQNPYEYATQLDYIAAQQKEAEKAAKAAQKAAQKAATTSTSTSSKSSSGSSKSTSSKKSSASQAEESSSISSLFGSESETSNTEEVPSIKTLQDIRQESFQRKKARRQENGRKAAAKEVTKENIIEPITKAAEKTTSIIPSIKDQDEEAQTTQTASNAQYNPFPQGSMEENLFDIRNAEMADKKAESDAKVELSNKAEQYRQEYAADGIDLDQYVADYNARTGDNKTVEDFVSEMEGQEEQEEQKDLVINADNINEYLDPNKKLDSKEQKAAQAYIDAYKAEHKGFDDTITLLNDATNQVARINRENGTNYTLNDYLEANGVSVQEYQEAREVQQLEQKLSDAETFVQGAINKDRVFAEFAGNMANKISGGKLDAARADIDRNATGAEKQANFYSEMEQHRQKEILEGQKTQNPVSFMGGKTARMAYDTLMMGGFTGGIGLTDYIASKAGGSALAKALTEVGLDTLLNDIPFDTIPEAIENYNNGMPLGEVIKNAGWSTLENATVNGILGAIPGITNYAQKQAIEQVEKQAAEYAETLGKNVPFNLTDDAVEALLPGLKQTDDVVKVAGDELNIDSLLKQSEDATNEINRLSEEVRKLTPEEDVNIPKTGEGDITYTTAQDQAIPAKTDAVVDDYVKQIDAATTNEDLVSIVGKAADANRQGLIDDNQIKSIVEYAFDDTRRTNVPNIADDIAESTNVARRTGFDTIDADYEGATVGEVVDYYTDNMKTIANDWGNKYADIINSDESIKATYERLHKAIDDFNDAALHTDNNLDDYYRKIDSARKTLYNKTKKVDAAAAKDPALGNSNVSVLKQADRARFEINTKIDDGKVASIPGMEDLAGMDRAEAYRSVFGEEPATIKSISDSADVPNNTISSMAESTGTAPARASVDVPPETPKATTPTNNVDSPDLRQRGYDRTYQSGRTNIQEGLKDEPEMYKVRHNADTQAQADSIYEGAKSLDEVETTARSLIREGDATAVPLTSKLINEYAKNGDTNKAVDLLNELEAKMTKSGQFTQAAKMTIVQSNPDVAKTYLQRQIDLMNDAGKQKFRGKWNNFKLTEDELVAFSNITPGDVDAISELYTQIGTRLGKEMPVAFTDKLNEYRKLAMLFNPRTHVRNVAANAVMLPVRSATDRVSAIGQQFYRLFNRDYNVTQSILPPSRADRQLSDTIFDNQIVQRLDGSKYAENATGMDAFNQAFNNNRQIFRDSKMGTMTKDVLCSDNSILNTISGGKLADAVRSGKITGSNLENLRRFDYYLLGELEDNPFVRANFNNRLGSYIRAQGVKDVADIPQEMIDVAYQEALKATFKDDNVLSDALGGIRSTLNKYSNNVLGDALFPFTKTPAAIAMRGIDYSPAGLATSIGKYLGSNRTDLDVSNLFDDLSKAVTGTSAITLGFLLAKEGVITGALSDNTREKQFQQTQGQQAYSIKIGDRYYSYDWAQPAAIPLILGATMYNAMEADDADISNLIWGGTKAGVDAWIELSPLQTIADVFGSGNYTGSFAEGVRDAAISYGSSYIPSIVGATARAVDNNYRTTYDKSSALDYAKNQIIAKIPGLSQTLPESYNTWGEERLRSESTGEAAFAQFANPGQLSVNNSSPIDEEILRLHDAVGENSVFPNKASWSVELGDGETKKLNSREYSDYQREMGQASYEYANAFVTSNELYSEISDANKASVLSDVYSLAKAQTERDLFGKPIAEGTTNAKLDQIYEEGGTEGLINYLSINAIIKDTGADANDTTRKVYNEGITVKGQVITGKEAVSMYVEAAEYLKANEMTNNEKNRQMYYNGQISNLEQKKEDSTTLDSYGLDYNETNVKVLNTYGEGGLEAKQVLVDAGYSFGDYEKQLYQSGGIPAIQDYVDTLDSLGSAGLKTTSEVYKSYQHATETIPGLTEKQYASAVKKIDSNNNSKVSQTEMLDYLNSNNYSQEDVEQLWNTFGEWSRDPYIKKDGTWGAK